MKEVQDKYKNDKERLNKALMALYKEHKVNPMSGCLPLLIQMPILILLFQVLRQFNTKIYAIYNGNPGFLWLKDLSLPDQLIRLGDKGIFGIHYLGIMPFLIGGSMYIQQKMTSPVSATAGKDEGSAQQTQKMMTIMMPLMIGFMSFSLPSGLTLYWFVSTLLGIGQQYLINKKTPTIVEMPKDIVSGKKEKTPDKKLDKPADIKEEPWIPGYEEAGGGNPSGGKAKTKKYKKGKKK
jgi:YidC/Oxa1 family membrane protein insertase